MTSLQTRTSRGYQPAYRPLFVHKVNHEHLALVRRAIAERQRNESSFEVRDDRA